MFYPLRMRCPPTEGRPGPNGAGVMSDQQMLVAACGAAAGALAGGAWVDGRSGAQGSLTPKLVTRRGMTANVFGVGSHRWTSVHHGDVARPQRPGDESGVHEGAGSEWAVSLQAAHQQHIGVGIDLEESRQIRADRAVGVADIVGDAGRCCRVDTSGRGTSIASA